MALVRAERVLETSTTTGTGSLTLGGPVTGYRSFASVMSTSDTCYYAIVAVDSSGRPSGAWETGLGTLAAATTLARTTVLASSNGGALVNLASGTKQVFLTLSATEIDTLRSDINNKSAPTTVDVITSSMTGGSGWLLPTGAKSVHVICIGGGGGGGGGAKNSSNTSDSASGGGGGGGARTEMTLPASAIGTPGTTRVNVTIGAGGTGGTGATAGGSSGGNGTDGGASSFGSFLFAPGGKFGSGASTGGYGGLVDYSGTVFRITPYNGGSGGASTAWSVINNIPAATGGGGGGSYGAGNVGSPIYLNSSLTAGTDGTAGSNTITADATAGAGGNGTSRSASGFAGGGGGCGGRQTAEFGTTGIGGQGGGGGVPGGGGGGGGSARSTSTRAGNGGAGGRGEVIVTVYY